MKFNEFMSGDIVFVEWEHGSLLFYIVDIDSTNNGFTFSSIRMIPMIDNNFFQTGREETYKEISRNWNHTDIKSWKLISRA